MIKLAISGISLALVSMSVALPITKSAMPMVSPTMLHRALPPATSSPDAARLFFSYNPTENKFSHHGPDRYTNKPNVPFLQSARQPRHTFIRDTDDRLIALSNVKLHQDRNGYTKLGWDVQQDFKPVAVKVERIAAPKFFKHPFRWLRYHLFGHGRHYAPSLLRAHAGSIRTPIEAAGKRYTTYHDVVLPEVMAKAKAHFAKDPLSTQFESNPFQHHLAQTFVKENGRLFVIPEHARATEPPPVGARQAKAFHVSEQGTLHPSTKPVAFRRPLADKSLSRDKDPAYRRLVPTKSETMTEAWHITKPQFDYMEHQLLSAVRRANANGQRLQLRGENVLVNAVSGNVKVIGSPTITTSIPVPQAAMHQDEFLAKNILYNFAKEQFPADGPTVTGLKAELQTMVTANPSSISGIHPLGNKIDQDLTKYIYDNAVGFWDKINPYGGWSMAYDSAKSNAINSVRHVGDMATDKAAELSSSLVSKAIESAKAEGGFPKH